MRGSCEGLYNSLEVEGGGVTQRDAEDPQPPPPEPPADEPYEPPQLKKYGSLAELTRSGTGTRMEGGKGPPRDFA